MEAGHVGLPQGAIPPLPDDVLARPEAGHVNIASWFEHPARPLHLEIGSGKGTFLMQATRQHPEVNYLGIEYAGEFFLYAADRLRRAAITNVKMLCLDAGEFVHWRVPSNSLHMIHLYFADPWPKRKHNRRRMISDRFLGDAARVLIDGGELRVVTDHADYWCWMEDHFARWCHPAPNAPFTREPFTPDLPAEEVEAEAGAPPSPREPRELVGTNFERKYREEGRAFYAAILRRKTR